MHAQRSIDDAYVQLRALYTRLILPGEAKDPAMQELAKVLLDVAEAELQLRDDDFRTIEEHILKRVRGEMVLEDSSADDD